MNSDNISICTDKGFEGWDLLTATFQIVLQPEALIRFASVFTNYVNVIKLFGFTANIASQTVIPLIKGLDAKFGREHMSVP